MAGTSRGDAVVDAVTAVLTTNSGPPGTPRFVPRYVPRTTASALLHGRGQITAPTESRTLRRSRNSSNNTRGIASSNASAGVSASHSSGDLGAVTGRRNAQRVAVVRSNPTAGSRQGRAMKATGATGQLKFSALTMLVDDVSRCLCCICLSIRVRICRHHVRLKVF